MRQTGRRVVLGGIAVLMLLACSATAVAAPKPPMTIANSQLDGAPIILVDSRGTVNALWTATENGGFPIVRYARERHGAKRFTQVSLPGMPSTDD